MKSPFATYLFLSILILLAGIPVQAQDTNPSTNPGALVRLAPEQDQICIFEPTNNDVFYYKGAEEFRKKGDSRAKTASFEVNYAGNWPQEARNAFEYAIGIWELHISSNVPIRIEANWVALGGSTLGSAGPLYVYPIDNVWYAIAQANAMTGQDLIADVEREERYDMVISINSSYNSWYYGTDANTPGGFIDFVTVVIHEVGHGLGFTGSMSGDSGTEVAEWGLGDDPVLPLIYDTFIDDGFSRSVLNENIYPNPSNVLYEAVTGNSGGLFFIDDQSDEAFINIPVPMYAPEEWESGSSYSHLDQTTFTNTENALMRPQVDNAFAIHSPGPIMCGIFGDTGWPLGGGCAALLGAQAIVQIDDSEIEFGVTNVNDQLDTTIVISNDINSESRLVGRVEFSSQDNAFSLNSSTIFLDIDPGQSQEIFVRYRPQFAGVDSVELRINHNGAIRENPILIKLKGEALEENRVVQLEQNYPNPFNAITNIPYAIPQDSYVRLEVFDILGKKVQTLVDGNRQRGRYLERINANELSSGIYIYRILVDGTQATGKFILAK